MNTEELTAKQLAEIKSCSVKTVYRYVKRGMPCKRAGENCHARFNLSEVNEWLGSQK